MHGTLIPIHRDAVVAIAAVRNPTIYGPPMSWSQHKLYCLALALKYAKFTNSYMARKS